MFWLCFNIRMSRKLTIDLNDCYFTKHIKKLGNVNGLACLSRIREIRMSV